MQSIQYLFDSDMHGKGRKKRREVSLDEAMARGAKNQVFDRSISCIFCYRSCYVCILQQHVEAVYLLRQAR